MNAPKIIDGSFGSQLKKYMSDIVDGDPLWASRYLVTQPEKCILVHRDFVKAGANILITNTYQATVEGFKTYLGLEKNEALAAIKKSVEIAREGIRLAEKETGKTYNYEVLGLAGPYGAYLHDCSEYTGSYCDSITEEELIIWHRPRLAALIEGGADSIILATCPCLKEGLAFLKLMKEFPTVKTRISFSIKDAESISSGENFIECVLKCWNSSNQLIEIGSNCYHPSLVTPLYKPLKENYPHIPTMAMPSNGDRYDSASGRWVPNEDGLYIEDYIEEWFDMGITTVGGCCPSTAEVTSKLSQKRDKWVQK